MVLADWKQWRIGRSGLPEFAGLVLVAIYMAAVSAYGGTQGPPAVRYLYWLVVMLGGGAIGAAIEPWLERIGLLARLPLLRGVAQALAMTPPILLLVWLVSDLMFRSGLDLQRLLMLAPSVFTVDVAVVILAWLVRRAYRRPAQAPAPTNVAPAAIRERLPPRLARAELLAVQAEDHYLRIHTAAGHDLILMKLTQALEALHTSDGMQVHRSWWVARRAVERASWRKGRGELELVGGLKVPVSTRYAATVKQTDWG